MVYMGSKDRTAKYLIPIMNKIIKDNNIDYFFDMCVGGGNLSANKKHHLDVKNIIGVDNNKYLIALLKKVQEKDFEFIWVSKEEYHKVKSNKNNYEDWYVGYVGFLCSFAGKFFNGYTGINRNSKRTTSKKGYNNLINQKIRLNKLNLFHKDIFNIDYNKLPKNSLLYFDPPYENTTKYHSKFDNRKFWELVNKLSKDFIVLVSEFNAPNDYISIWSKEKVSRINSQNVYKKDMEHLFVHKDNLKYINIEEV